MKYVLLVISNEITDGIKKEFNHQYETSSFSHGIADINVLSPYFTGNSIDNFKRVITNNSLFPPISSSSSSYYYYYYYYYYYLCQKHNSPT
jgi:hypothetical protein